MPHFLDALKEKLHPNAPHPTQHNTASPQDTAVNTHNTARTPKSCPPVTWDDKLAADATAYAQQLANEDKLHHSGVVGQGENLYWSSEADATFDDAVQMWLREGEKYHDEKIGQGTLSDYGHYTQVMWKNSIHLGMGRANSEAGGTYIVGRYTPQGNMYGEKPY